MRSKQQGFTLTELLIVIAIVAVMAAIAFPNMSNWIASRRAASQAEQVANLLRFARSEAVRLNLPVYVCPVQIRVDGTPNDYCNLQHAGQGIAAFADADNNRIYERNTADIDLRTVILNAQNEERTSYQFDTYDFDGSPQSKNLVWAFYPNGTFGHAGAANGTFTVGGGFVRVAVTDAAAKDDNTKAAARASILLIDSSGRVQACSRREKKDKDGEDKNSTIDKLCKYDTSSS
ncbi:GspH/FimT family pseudopilin [Neisseria sp.]|uniref:GspH/FimT family pseudopilin n=1 Tax=Neisseria sp. TaxID=192066 RepID=UPI0026DD5AA1|nr:GspH/FimT family pseudopilin [Neisseria sp.]MDO4906983.1 GspH/FimT family pseudopilin [Neisseria sp.]